MRLAKYLFVLLIVSVTTFNAHAEKIYKTVDESGAVVFSDKKTPDAETIRLQPNVISVRTPVMPEPVTSKKKPKQSSAKQNTIEQEAVGRGTATAGNLKRKIRNVSNGGENIKRPIRPPATTLPVQRPGARPGGGGAVGDGRAGGGR